MAWKQNIIEDFKQLVSFDSISFHERKTADWLIERLQKMGFSVEEDDAGSHYGGDTGNLYAVLDGTLPGDPVIFCAHMDVVEPRSGKKSVLEKDGTIHSAGDTVLGADDISGILEILYGVQLVIDSGKPHKKIELLFTIGEELYVKGSDVFDYSKVTAKQAYVLDLSGAVGDAARRAPSIISVRAEIRGKAAHLNRKTGSMRFLQRPMRSAASAWGMWMKRRRLISERFRVEQRQTLCRIAVC